MTSVWLAIVALIWVSGHWVVALTLGALTLWLKYQHSRKYFS